ncbi:MAG: hypothetical protein KAZ42_00470 [Proteocatella sp.]|jgi:hypothetical protein|nr:hypothetical protein [Proteocatella sp.]NCB70593.1 hypothetical protein [Clostridia bacterium]MBP7912993.1 hypothetical protein [Proteocatella sp.]MBP8654336.1 hypothetical protein [Proteocatella sp.]MBP9658948.1 hypothetical protein [Proteocatella sp.]
MRNQQLEKKIMKIDRDIEGLNIAKKYLSNPEEIEDVKVGLNRERQLMIFGLYEEDNKSRQECIEMLSELAGQELRKEKQLEILENIKEIFGRRFPDVSKNSNGLNAWLNFIDMECEWIQDENSEWAKLVIKSL